MTVSDGESGGTLLDRILRSPCRDLGTVSWTTEKCWELREQGVRLRESRKTKACSQSSGREGG